MRQARKTLTLTSLILKRINSHYLPRSSTSFYKYFWERSQGTNNVTNGVSLVVSVPFNTTFLSIYTVSPHGWSWATGDGRGSLQAIVSHVTRPYTFKYYVSKNSLLLVSFANTSRASPFSLYCKCKLNSLLITLGRLKILYQIASLWFKAHS